MSHTDTVIAQKKAEEEREAAAKKAADEKVGPHTG